MRPFNTYGPRQSARAVIPSIITQLLEKKKSIQLGDTNPTRDLLYVNDTVDAFIKIAECDKLLGEDCNIATQTEISIEALAKQLIAMIHPSSVIEIGEERKRPEKSEVFRLLGSAEKLKKLTGWQPAHSLQQGLEKTIAWYSNSGNRSSFKTDIYNI